MEASFEHVTPESAGISSSLISQCIKSLDRNLVPMHSLLIMRGGKLLTEAYWKPWNSDRLHRMYSCTKSFVSIAIGCLLAEGKLALDDPIIRYFPEYESERCHDEWLESTTIRNMLMMASCHRRTAYKEGSSNWSYIDSFSGHDWVKPFFIVPPDHAPGRLFIYDTSATQTLAALCEKLAGEDILSYLKKEFFTDPGFFEDAYIIKEPGGHSAGGSGLMCRPLDMIYAINKVMHFNDGGILGNYIKEATAKRIETSGSRFGLLDTFSGYGYQIWMNSHGYMFYGMGSQLIIAIPDKDMAIAVTADTQGISNAESLIFDAVWKIADSAASSAIEENPSSLAELEETISSLSLKAVQGSASSPVSLKVSGKEYFFNSNTIGLERLKCTFRDGYGTLDFCISGTGLSIEFGLGCIREAEAMLPDSVPSVSSAAWKSDGTLSIVTEYIGEECGSLIIQLAFDDQSVTAFMHQNGELSIMPINGVASSR